MTTTIRISQVGTAIPRAGFAGALGVTDPGGSIDVEVSTDVTQSTSAAALFVTETMPHVAVAFATITGNPNPIEYIGTTEQEGTTQGE